MGEGSWAIERLRKTHEVEKFSCGEEALDLYLKKFAAWNDSANVARTFVAVRTGEVRVAGFYTLSNGAVAFERMPEKVPGRYPVPVAVIGRLAVDQAEQGKGLGEFLLMDALARADRAGREIAIFAVNVKAKGERARAFYLKYGFKELVDNRLDLYLPMKVVKKLGLNR